MGIIKVNRKDVSVRENLHTNPMSQPGHALAHAKTTKEQFNLIGAGRRNLLINGDFQIWQRGTTVSISSSGYGHYGPDRWGQYYANGGTTVERQSVTVDGKLTYAARCNTDNDGRIYFHQQIENGSKLLSDKDYTLSFWARCNPGEVGKLEIERYFVNLDTTGGYGYQSSSEEYVEPEWKYFEFNFRDIDNTQTSHDRFLQIAIATETYSPRPDWVEFAFVQLELGKVATPFEYRSYGEELALCQRYYYLRRGHTGQRHVIGYATSTSQFNGVIDFPITMRTTPTIVTSGVTTDYTLVHATGGVVNIGALPTYGGTEDGGYILVTGASGLTAGSGAQLRSANSNGFLAFDAEFR